jgi:hypothetical protein
MAKTWKGMLAPIGKPTGDGRMFAPNSLTNRDLPLPLRFQRQDGGGHGGAVVVGRILTIEYHDDHAYAAGDWLDPKITPEVTEAQEWSVKKVIGPSVDLDDAVMELVPVDQQAATEAAAEASACGCDDAHATKEVAEQPMIKLVTQGRISGATLVQIPAFAECAALELADETGDTLTAAGDLTFNAGDPVTIAGEDDEDDDTGFYVSMSDDGQWVLVVRDNGETDRVHVTRVGYPDEAELRAWDAALTAAAAQAEHPPAAWFTDPKLSDPTPLTITDDGRVYGHLATWGTCHVGLPGCVTAPRSHTSYAFFHTGEVIADDGRSIEVGKITLGTGHADPHAGFRAAADHYDHSGACVAVVRAGEDAHGVWVAGTLTAGCDERKVAELRRSPLSGDWRRIGNGLELVAALAVNVPGFPVPRSRVASGVPMSLVAAGWTPSLHPRTDDGKFKPARTAGNPGRVGHKKELPKVRKRGSGEGHGSYWRGSADEDFEDEYAKRKKKPVDDDGDEVVDDEKMMDVAEKAVRKVNKRKKTYQAALDTFAEIEQERAGERVEAAALLLEVIDII